MRDEWEPATVVQIQPIVWDRDGQSEIFDYYGILRVGQRFVGFQGYDCCRNGTHAETFTAGTKLYRRVRDGALSIHPNTGD